MPSRQRAGDRSSRGGDAAPAPADPDKQVRDVNSALDVHVADLRSHLDGESHLRASEERFRLQYQAMPVPVYTWRNVKGDFVLQDFNSAGEAITEGVVRSWLGRRASELYAHDPQVLAEFRRCATEQRTVRRTMPFQFKTSGKRCDLDVSYVFVPPDLVMVHTEDVTERTRAEADLRHQALHDDLTGLANRVMLNAELERTFRVSESNERPCALLLLDVDRFKEVNDTLGHQAGDSLLQLIGQRLEGAVGATDLVARLGGDEFAVLLPGRDALRAAQVAEDLVRILQAPFVIEGQALGVDASIGIAAAPEHSEAADMLLRCADVAMYEAKRAGVGVTTYSRCNDQHRPDQLGLVGELRQAIQRDELLLDYQPKLDLRDGRVVGVEALIRWQHPHRGLLPPSEFIPLAERSGLIHSLSQWLLETAVRQQQIWRSMSIDLPVAVNLSRRTLHDPHLLETVVQLLRVWDVPASALVVEITESSLMADPIRAGQNLKHLRAHGVSVSIDDFGTGYSSLASLKDLPVDELKIDRSFIQAMATDASSRAIVRAIIDLADALRLRVVAEGVEDRATWDLLGRLGCDVAQGYLLSPSLAASEMQAWIANVAPAWLRLATPLQAQDPLQERIRGRGARLTAEEEFIARHEAEAALHVSEERNRLALQAAGMGTWDLDVTHDVVGWSPEMEVIAGLAPGSFDGTFTALQQMVHPDDRLAFETELRGSLDEHRDFACTYRIICSDGSVRWIEGRGRAVYAVDCSPQRINGTSMDVTQRKLAEEALRTSEERFRKQYKSFPLPTYSWLHVDGDFVLGDHNDAAENSTEFNDWIQKPSGSVAHAADGIPAVMTVAHASGLVGVRASERFADQPQLLADLHACMSAQQAFRRELHVRYPMSGQERDLALSYVFVPPLTVMVHLEDITDAKHAERQRQALAQSSKQRALRKMASSIAHELNQSLMLVASYSDLARRELLQDLPDLAQLTDLMTTTTQAALDGGETVKRLLLFARAAPAHDRQPVDLTNVVREAAQLAAPRLRSAAREGRPIQLHILADGCPTIEGSPSRLRELLANLISNAVDALPSGGTVQLRIAVADEHAIIEVVDTGMGMTAEVQERAFEPFFTTKGEAGTGLGLANVFGIVEQHGGHIQVHSAPGNGASFRMLFPVLNSPTSFELVEMAPAPLDEVARPLRILAVDDEPMITKAVTRMLTPSGHLVSVAESGKEALEKLAEQTFDVVISDLGMGTGMNGWELANLINRRWPGVRFLLATGWGASIDPADARARGVDAVLAKPYHPIDLARALSRISAAA